MATQPYYSLATPSAVPLYEGQLFVPAPDGVPPEPLDGTAAFELTPRPHILFRGSVSLRILQELVAGSAAPRLPMLPWVPDPPETVPEASTASWLGPVGGCIAGETKAARAVTFHLVNFTDLLGGPITDGTNTWSGRLVASPGPWTITVDARLDLADSLRTMGHRGGYAITHTCRLERRDGRDFSFARSEQLLTCLTWCLWFCRASAPGVVLPVGFDRENRAIWSRWAAPHIDPLPDSHWQWLDQVYGADQLSTLLPKFFDRWKDPVWKASLQRAIRYYADASVMGTLERNLVLAQVALEALAFAYLVKASKQLTSNQFKAPVSRHIRQFLRDMGIPTTIPRTFYGLRKVRANSPWDGPAAIAWLRNDIVHAANHRVQSRRWKLWYQGWQLAMWYLELAVLAVVKYDGVYRNRLAGHPERGAVESVPWAKGTELT